MNANGGGSSPSLPLVARPRFIPAVVSIIVAAITVAELVVYPPHSQWTLVVSLAHIGAIAMMPICPRFGGAFAVSATMIAYVIPDPSGPSFIWGTWYALAYLGLRTRGAYGLLFPTAVCVGRVWHAQMMGMRLPQYALLLVAFFVAFFVGKGLSWRQVAFQAERDRIRYEQAQTLLAASRKEAAAASHIHDMATGNLTYMVLMLDHMDAQRQTEVDREAIRNLRERTMATLREVRKAINILDGDGQALPEGGAVPLYSRLQSTATQGDRYLKELGFSGKTTISNGLTPLVSVQCGERIASLLHELYTNIAVHAKPYGEYHISIWQEREILRLTQVNEVSGDNLFPDKPLSGKGLKFHADGIRELGGSIRTSYEDDAWVLHVNIPIHAATAGTATEEATGD